MKNLSRFTLIGFAIMFYIACSPQKFEKTESSNCQGLGSGACIVENGMDKFDQSLSTTGGKVDILIVDDNSGSMSYEQSRMAAKFSSFLTALDQQQIDYRIALTTTDISSASNGARSINQNGALQDGRLVSFGGTAYLTPSTPNKESLFSQAVQRAETATCENFLVNNRYMGNTAPAGYSAGYLANCPSQDEMGIYAANLFVTNNPQSFIRTGAHLAIIFLADEDERSALYFSSPNYRLSTNNLPQTLVQNVRTRFVGKSFSAHSIIVKPGSLVSGQTATQVASALAAGNVNPSSYFTGGDSWCRSQQSGQINNGYGNAVDGSYGFMYSLLSKMTGGIEGDICANDYGSQLYNIGVSITEKTSDIALACANPIDLSVTFTPSTAAVSYSVQGSTLKLASILAPASRVRVTYSCTQF